MEVKLFDSIQQAKEILIEREPRLVKFRERTICVVLLNEQIIAFDNNCPHMGHTLHQGNVNYLNEIVCPLHTYRFNLVNGEEAEQRCSSLKYYEVQIEEEVVLFI